MALIGPDGFSRGFAEMTAAEYHADPAPQPALSASIARILIAKSPAHAHEAHPRLGGRPEEHARHFDFGSTVHSLVLGAGREVVQVDAKDWRTKDARAKRDAFRAIGKVPVLRHEAAALLEAAEAIVRQLRARGIELDGQSELAAFWVEHADDGTPVQCRCMFDHWKNAVATIFDVKSSRSAHPRAIAKHVEAFGYDIAAAAYTRAIEALLPELAGRVRYRWVFAELEPPFPVVVAEPAGSLRVLGASRWRRAINTWARCMREQHWPAYHDDGVLQVEAMPWAMTDEMASGALRDVPFGGDDDEEGRAA